MSATSLIFIPFLFSSFVGCWIFEGRLRKLTLFIMNTVFALSFVKIHLLYLLFITLISWGFGLLLKKNKQKAILLLGCGVVIAGLVFMKLAGLLPLFSSWVTPVGISFYSFKAVSYLADVYTGKCKVVKNLVDVYCYISFFPSFTAGPIHRATPFFKELNRRLKFDYTFAKNGVVLCAFGMFEKMVFSDYIAIITNNIFSNEATGITLILGLVLYSFQIYLDFDSYSNIAIGAAQCLGFNIGPNFKTPYLAASLKDFWRRWHISLSSWFRDYVYIPLGGNRKGKLRRYINLIIVFLLSGIWHGSTMNFALWGLGHGVFQVIQDILVRSNNKKDFFLGHFLKIVVNFVLVTFLWIFFRCATLSEAMNTIINCTRSAPLNLEWMGINQKQFIWLIIVLIIVIITDVLRNKMNMIEWLSQRNFLIRWGTYILLIVVFLVFGIYGSGYNSQDFIYIQF